MLYVYGATPLVLLLLLFITSSAASENLPVYYGQLCQSDTDVEAREALADVVISGRVKALHKRAANDFYSSTIHVYRVIKGSRLVNSMLNQPLGSNNFYGKNVEVYGFGNPMICESDIRHGDSRIILASYRNTTLHLNSSLVRVGFRTLRPRQYQAGELGNLTNTCRYASLSYIRYKTLQNRGCSDLLVETTFLV